MLLRRSNPEKLAGVPSEWYTTVLSGRTTGGDGSEGAGSGLHIAFIVCNADGALRCRVVVSQKAGIEPP